ncbi:hypothetical protein ACQ4PT_017257 [Festuca glaucescens]
MAIAVGHCHDLKPPAARGRHYRPHSVAQLDRPLLGRDHQERNDLSPQRRCLSSPCFTTVFAPASEDQGAEPAGEDKKMPRVEIVAGRHARGVHALIAEAAGAIASGTRLVPAQGGLGGALLLKDGRSGEHVAVIKPLDDKSSPSNGGGGYESKAVLREVAAYLLDHDGFATVSPTAMIKISRPTMETTVASIQRFVAHHYDAGVLGPSRFSVQSVHRVGILDVRLLNIDRHAGNILVKNPPTGDGSSSAAPLELVPIDHGLCLPEQLEDPYFEWLHWPQASRPFSSAELDYIVVTYIASLDPFKDAEMLRAELPSLTEPPIRILTLCEGLSALEALCKKAVDSIDAQSLKSVSFGELSCEEWTTFLEKFEQLLPPAFEAKKSKPASH